MHWSANKYPKPVNPSTVQQTPLARDWLILLFIIAVGAFFRFFWLGSIPPGLWYDEAINGLDALSLIDHNPFQIFFTTEGHPREPLFMYTIAGMFLLFGASAEVLRATSALLGVITIPLLYILVKELWGRRLALLAAFCLAGLRWHLHFSCLNFRTILVPVLEIPVFYFFIRGVKYRRWQDFLVSGLLLGLGFYSYPAFRLVPVILLALIIYLHFTGQFRIRPHLNSILIMALAALVIFTPLLVDYIINPFHFSGRIQQVTLFDKGILNGVKAIMKNAWLVLIMFSFKGDPEPKHNLAFLPVFDIITSLFFYLGFYLLVRGLRRNSTGRPDQGWSFLILVWFAIMLLPTIFSFGAPNLLRTLAVTPAVATILALGLDKAYDLLARRFSPTLAIIAVLLFACYFAVTEYNRYWQWGREPLTWERLNSREYELALESKRLAEKGKTVYIPQMLFTHPTFQFVIQPVQAENGGKIGRLRLPQALRQDKENQADHIIALSQFSDIKLHKLIQYLYKGVKIKLLQTPWGEAWATLYQIDGSQLLTRDELEGKLSTLGVDISTIEVSL